MKKNISIIIICFAFFAILNAQSGSIKGVVKDKKTGETIVGANVIIQGTTIGTSTDLDGNYEISGLAPGTYNVLVSFVSYKKQILQVKVGAGVAVLNYDVDEEATEIGEVKVTAARKTGSDIDVLNKIKTSDVVLSGISSQMIQKSQDKDASEVVRRVPGITITDGRFIVVRGLIERYNSVLLNGASAPSFENDVRAFSFDAIPSGIIDNIEIYKSPAPHLPADFAGAAVNVVTKNNADKNEIKVNYSAGYQDNTSMRDFYTYEGGKMDWLGYDDGTRSMPTSLPGTQEFTSLFKFDDAATVAQKKQEITDISRSFKNNWSPVIKRAGLNHSASVSSQSRFVLGKVSIGNITSVNYSRSNEYINRFRGEYQDYDDSLKRMYYNLEFYDNRYTENVKAGLIHNWNIIFGNNHKIEFRNFLNQMGKDVVNLREGVNFYNNDTLKLTELKYQSRFIYSGQIAGKFNFFDDRTKIDVLAGYGRTINDQPDIRRVTYQLNTNIDDPNYHLYQIRMQTKADPLNAGRIYMKLDEKVYNFAINLDQHIFKSEDLNLGIKAGTFIEIKERSFYARSLGVVKPYNTTSVNLFQSVDSVMNSNNFFYATPTSSSGLVYREGTLDRDRYKANNNIFAYYAGLRMNAFKRLSVYGGIRAESFYRKLSDFYFPSPGIDSLDIVMDTLDIFPSVNATFNINEKHLLRFSYGKTTNRPEFRELSSFVFTEFEGFYIVYGNDTLRNSYIDNFDLRYEFYPSPSEVISIGAFYKKFENPIEVFLIQAGTGYDYKPFNSKEAIAQGLEFDLRKSLHALEQSNWFWFLKDLTLVFNTSIIKSEINTVNQKDARDSIRIMQGQSPYIINAGMYYQNDSNGIMVSLMYNRIGDRIAYVGTPDNPHTWELARNSLDFSISKKFGKYYDARIGIKDILNAPVEFVQYYGSKENISFPTRRYLPGRLFTIGFGITF